MSNRVDLLCIECYNDSNKVSFRDFRPDDEKQTMAFQCAKCGERKVATKKQPAKGIEVK